jgi:hypothetical protein
MKKASIIIVQLFCLVVFLSFTADAQSNCTYTVNPNSFVVPVSGGNYSLDITTQAGCPWTATPFQSTRPPSINFTSPTSGTGSGKVDFTIAANITPSIREGGIAIRSSDFSTRASVEIVQDVQCADPMFSPSVVNAPGEGSPELSFGWSPSSINCSYITVRSNDSWITLTGMSPEQRYTFSVAPNTGPARTGTISIIINTRVNTYQKIGTLTVNQAAGQSNCTYSISAVPYVFYLEGGARTINVTTEPGCAWQAIPSNDWITITSGQSGSGNGSVNYSVSTNNGDARRGTINISGRIIEINQRANCFANFNSGPFNFPASGGTFRYPGPFYQGCSFSSISTMPASWISETGDGGFFIAPNTGPARSAVIELTGPSGSVSTGNGHSFVTISQAAAQTNCTYTLTRNYTTPLPKSGGNYSITVNTQEGCAWTVENNTPWIVITSGSSGTGSGTISFTLQPNTSGTRGATISVAGQSVNLLQSGGCIYTPTPASINVPSNGGQGSFTINHSEGCANFDIDYTHNPWINVVNITREGTLITFFYSVDKNLGEARTGTIIFSDPFSPPGGIFTVNQAGQTNCTYTLSPAVPLEVPYNGGNYSLNIITQPGCQWTAQFSSSNTIRPVNLTFTSPTSGVGSGKVDFIIAPAPTSSSRAGRIILNGNYAIGVDIGQEGDCGVILLNPSSVNTLVEGGQGNFRLSLNSANCTANVQSNDSWITASGTNVPMGLIGYSVAPNSGAPRTGTISVTTVGALGLPQKTATFTVNQAGQTNCTYSINPTSIQAGVAGGDAGFNITTETGCNWTAQSNASWITVSNTTGSGAGRINYSIQSNTGAARQGTITAGGQTFTINQDAVATPVELIRASGRVIDANFKSVRGAIVSFTNLATGETRTTTTNHFGYFHFANIEREQSYSVTISHKRYKFTTRTVIYNTGALIPIYNPDPEP